MPGSVTITVSRTTNDIFGELILGSVYIVLVIGLLILCSTPGRIARRRHHPNASTINICGWLGAIFFPMLIVAFIWARSEPREEDEDHQPAPDNGRALGFPVKVIPVEPIPETPG